MIAVEGREDQREQRLSNGERGACVTVNRDAKKKSHHFLRIQVCDYRHAMGGGGRPADMAVDITFIPKGILCHCVCVFVRVFVCVCACVCLKFLVNRGSWTLSSNMREKANSVIHTPEGFKCSICRPPLRLQESCVWICVRACVCVHVCVSVSVGLSVCI